MDDNKYLLKVEDLRTHFFTHDGVVPAVDGVSFNVKPGETLCVVGESGCGKSVTAMSILQLIPMPPGRFVSGSIIYGGEDLTKYNKKQMMKIRGKEIAMIFQEPMTSLNPVFTIGNQITEAIRKHNKVSREEAKTKAINILEKVGIPSPKQRFKEYPHQLSGGMKQRAMIAMALSCNPKLLIADEPTTALDVTIQAQILDIMKRLKENTDAAIIFITHDLGVVADMADRVIVMYAGKIVERGSRGDIFNDPKHPYTKGLIKSVPKLQGPRKVDLHVIEGAVPSMYDLPMGCKFHPRCEYSTDICMKKEPAYIELGKDRGVACWNIKVKVGEAIE